MKSALLSKLFWIFSAVLGGALSPSPLMAEQVQNKTVALLMIDSRPCTFFTLYGVTSADPSVPGSGAWFALPKTAANYEQLNAMLLSAKVSRSPVTVVTNGTTSCDLIATVTSVMIEQ